MHERLSVQVALMDIMFGKSNMMGSEHGTLTVSILCNYPYVGLVTEVGSLVVDRRQH